MQIANQRDGAIVSRRYASRLAKSQIVGNEYHALRASRFALCSEKGIGLVEIIILAAALGLSMVGVSQMVVFMQRSSERAANQKTAVFLAEEATEALVSLKRAGWTANIASLAPGTAYYITRGGSAPSYVWQTATTDPGPLYGLPGNFGRSIVLARVYRDGSDNIMASGTEDVNMRRVTVTVTWTEKSQSRSSVFESYIANVNSN